MQLVECRQRHVNGVVVWILAAAKGTLLFIERTDHGKKLALDLHFFTYRILLPEEIFSSIVGEHDNIRTERVFIRRVHAATGETEVIHVGHRGGGSVEDGVLNLVFSVLHAESAEIEAEVLIG